MIEAFESYSILLKTFWIVAIPTSLIFIVQTLMTFLGSDASEGLEADFDSNLEGVDTPFQLFSLRNLINFLLGFSWTGISFYSSIESQGLLILLSLAVGLAFLFVFFIIIREIQKLAEDNSFKLNETLQKTAEVYLPIPGMKSGKGKVSISIRGAMHELDAISERDAIPSNAIVRVVRIEGNALLVVEPI
jgi:membrane-bound ClpP family serine protease